MIAALRSLVSLPASLLSKVDTPDLLMAAAVLLICWGLSMIYLPAVPILGGLALAAVAWRMAGGSN